MTHDKATTSLDQKKRKYHEESGSSNIVEFIKSAKKKESDECSGKKVDSGVKEKKLRFKIEGEELNSNKGVESKEKKKIRKPRWTEERKIEEKKRREEEGPRNPVEVIRPSKKKKTKKTKFKAITEETNSPMSTLALQYLQHWQYDRSSWKFSKGKQTWLLKHTFNLKKIPTTMFPVLVEYISSCKGGARLKTYETATKIIHKLEEKASAEESENDDEEKEIMKCLEGEDSEQDKEEIHQRARSIMQQLSDCT